MNQSLRGGPSTRVFWSGALLVLLCTCLVFGAAGPAAKEKADVPPEARQSLALQEKALVDKLKQSRDEYNEALKELEQFYGDWGDYPRLKKVQMELADIGLVRTSDYQNWEDMLGLLKPEKDIPEAKDLFAQAQGLRKKLAFRVKTKEANLKKAAVIYRQLIQDYPDSELVDDAAYWLGRIHESIYFGNHQRAVTFYRYCFEWNPKTVLPARYRAAQVCHRKLHEFGRAAKLYWLSSLYTVPGDLRNEAKRILKLLQQKGYGADLGEKPKESAAPKE